MSAAPKSVRLLTVEIRFEQDVVLARQRARQLCAALGFEPLLQTRMATALSEIARNAFEYAKGGRVEFSVLTEAHPAGRGRVRQTLVIEVRDNGAGIVNLEEILGGRYESQSGLGLGIVGARRLMDRVDIATSEKGTAITMAKIFPPSVGTCTAVQLQAIVDELARSPTSGPLEEIQVQNQELLRAMEESRARQEELARVNQELAETNAGVMALYDELDTVNRISIMLASKLETKSLIQSIIDVTTTLTNADVGAFFFRDEYVDHWRLYASSGGKTDALASFPPGGEPAFFGPDFVESGMVHIPDIQHFTKPFPGSRFVQSVADKLAVRSFLSVPVTGNNHALIGAFVFASVEAAVFTERSERILTGVTAQAATGIEKAQLYQTVTAASQAKDHFLAVLSHELRTPLTPVLMAVHTLLHRTDLPEDVMEALEMISRNVKLETNFIDDLLDLTRVARGKIEIVLADMNLHEAVRRAVEISTPDLDKKKQRLTISFNAGRNRLPGDFNRLQQVFWNLLKNASKFTLEGGDIEIRSRNDADRIIVEVADSGIGLEEEAIAKIFNPFEQADDSIARRFGGLGLGLAIAKATIEAHGGRLSASSAGTGKGATFIVSLPLTR